MHERHAAAGETAAGARARAARGRGAAAGCGLRQPDGSGCSADAWRPALGAGGAGAVGCGHAVVVGKRKRA